MAQEGEHPGPGGSAPAALTLQPIGIARTGFTERVEAPRQPDVSSTLPARIELFPGRHFEDALTDLAGWDMIWVLFWFHLNEGWRPKVQPPRSTTGRKGLFSTRSPHRPNPLGLSALRLERVEGLTVHVRGADLVDGTPVLDIKPYVAYTDAFPEAGGGWLAKESTRRCPDERTADPVPAWQVRFGPRAVEQLRWVEERSGFPMEARITAVLALGPEPHAYRRIRREGDGFVLALRDWRAVFDVSGAVIEVTAIRSGYRPSGQATAPPVHREFVARWGE